MKKFSDFLETKSSSLPDLGERVILKKTYKGKGISIPANSEMEVINKDYSQVELQYKNTSIFLTDKEWKHYKGEVI